MKKQPYFIGFSQLIIHEMPNLSFTMPKRRGLLTVSVDSADKRSRRLALTDDGRNLLADAVPIWKREHAALDRLLAKPSRKGSGPDLLRDDLRALS